MAVAHKTKGGGSPRISNNRGGKTEAARLRIPRDDQTVVLALEATHGRTLTTVPAERKMRAIKRGLNDRYTGPGEIRWLMATPQMVAWESEIKAGCATSCILGHSSRGW